MMAPLHHLLMLIMKRRLFLDNAALLEWLLSGCSVKEELSTWMQWMEMRKSKGIEYFHTLKKKFKQLEILHDIKYVLLSYGKTL